MDEYRINTPALSGLCCPSSCDRGGGLGLLDLFRAWLWLFYVVELGDGGFLASSPRACTKYHVRSRMATATHTVAIEALQSSGCLCREVRWVVNRMQLEGDRHRKLDTIDQSTLYAVE